MIINSDNPGEQTPVTTKIYPMSNPKITISKTGEYLVPVTTVLAISTRGINKKIDNKNSLKT
jgi:hypothetical protein